MKARFAVALLILLFAGAVGCKDNNLTEEEVELIEAILRSGLEMDDDAYVRAETLRVIELTGDERLASWADPLTRDDDPMVRVAALRVLVQADPGSATTRARALNVFARGETDERYEVLDVALAYGDPTLRRTLIERAQRSSAPRLRLRALQEGLFVQIDEARAAGNDDLLRQELLPELGTIVDDEDPEVAATALAALIEAGQTDRADRFIATFADPGADIERRVDAGRILLNARVRAAEDTFHKLLEAAGAYDPGSLGVPQRRIDERLLRLAVLGLVAMGREDFVEPALGYRTGATVDDNVEILRALGENPHPDAAVTLSTAMRDASPAIRRTAIALYGVREDASFSRLRGAMDRDDFISQRLVAGFLSDRFADEWQRFLGQRLDSDDTQVVQQTLRTMQILLRTEEELQVLQPMTEQLLRLATDDDPETASLAAYLLFRVSDEGEFQEILRQNRDPQTRYAYLEHLATHHPQQHIAVFRNHLLNDHFSLRLMSAAGLVLAFQDSIEWEVVEAEASDEES